MLSSKTSELEGFSTVFRTFDWWWVPPAVAVEIGSYFCFAAMQFELLKAGHLRAPWKPLLKLTFASQAITNSLPIGNAFASVYGFRWFRRFGADNTLAVWALIGTLVAASMSLSLLAIVGLGVATQEGASLDLVPVLIGTFIVLLGIGSLFVYERPLHAVLSWALRFSVAVTGRPRGDTVALIDNVIAWMTAVRLSWSQIGRIIAWGTLNWLLDCACFAMMFLALGVPIPWKGLLARLRRRPARRLAAHHAGRPRRRRGVHHGGARRLRRGRDQHRLRRSAVPGHQLLDDPGGRVGLHRPARAAGSSWALAPAGALERGRGRPRGLRVAADAGFARRRRVKPVPLRTRAGAVAGGLVLAASLLASCSSARTDSGTSADSCYLALPTAAKAVGGHGHLEGVRKYSLSNLRSIAPKLYGRLADDVPKKQAICIAGYSGHFTSSEVSKPLGHRSGTLAVAVVTTPANRLLGTLVLSKIPVRFQHTFPFLG